MLAKEPEHELEWDTNLAPYAIEVSVLVPSPVIFFIAPMTIFGLIPRLFLQPLDLLYLSVIETLQRPHVNMAKERG